jgi:hypothetical protein
MGGSRVVPEVTPDQSTGSRRDVGPPKLPVFPPSPLLWGQRDPMEMDQIDVDEAHRSQHQRPSTSVTITGREESNNSRDPS